MIFYDRVNNPMRHPHSSGFAQALFSGITSIVLSCAAQSHAQNAPSQTIPLSSQWNLIAFQVVPTNPAPSAVFGGLTGFQVAWSWDSMTNSWTRYVKTGDPLRDSLENALPGVAMAAITPGKAYWVYGSGMPANWEVAGTAPAG
ncbi:MAG: hypothetical protein EOP86_16490, partial [Verrucomicrobiaceae bacterium]